MGEHLQLQGHRLMYEDCHGSQPMGKKEDNKQHIRESQLTQLNNTETGGLQLHKHKIKLTLVKESTIIDTK
jgi:hypothetical protein